MNRQFLNGCLYFFLLLHLVGCASNGHSLPDWITNIPQDTSTKLYGLGEGRSVSQAKKSALLDIAAKIETHVQSQSSSNTVLRNGVLNETFQQQINTQVSEMKLSNYQVEKVETINGRYYALVALSRVDFIKNQKITFHRLNKNIDTVLAIAANEHIKKLVAYSEASTIAVQATATALIISTLDKTFSISPYLDKFENIKQTEKDLISKTYFYIQATRQFHATKKLLENALIENGFQVANKAQSNAVIDIAGTIKEKFLFSTYNVRAKVVVQLKAMDDYVLSGHEYDALGSSFSSIGEARDSAFYTLFKTIDTRQKVYQFVGLQEAQNE